MRSSILYACITLLISCGSPSVTEELSTSQVKRLIEKDLKYEDIIKDLNAISFAFEKDPVLKAKLARYSYADYLDFLNLLEDSTIAIESQERGRVKALNLFSQAKAKFNEALEDTIQLLRAIDANQIAQISFEKYQFTQSNEEYDFQRLKVSSFHFKVQSKKPIKAIHIEYGIYGQREDGTSFDLDHYDDEFVINEGFYYYFSPDSKKIKDTKEVLGNDFKVISKLEYDGETLGELKSRLRIGQSHYEMSDNNRTLFAKIYGDRVSTESFKSGKFRVKVKDLFILDEDGNEYTYPVQSGAPSFDYSNSYNDSTLFKLLRYFFDEPNRSVSVFQKPGYWACFNSYYNHVGRSVFNKNSLDEYINDTFGLDEYVSQVEKKNELGIELKNTISKYLRE